MRHLVSRPAHLIRRGGWATIVFPADQKPKKCEETREQASQFDLVERARALPLILREADEIERTRRLTPPVVSA